MSAENSAREAGAEHLPAPQPASEPNLTNTARDRARHRDLFQYGNYSNYYAHRQQAVPDARLSLLPAELIFLNKAVLDLGCNAGKITTEVVQYLGATKAKGVDIDSGLIEQARKLYPRQDRVEWQCVDFMREDIIEEGVWDTILLLSVTKWLHLHAGDAGLRRLFERLFHALPESGTLVVEPQEKENYARAVKKNKNLRPMYHTIKMWPPFSDALRDIGFDLIGTIEREEGGFSRPLMLWRKPSKL